MMKRIKLALRPLDPETDLPDLARLYGFIRPEPVSLDQVRDWWQPKTDEIRQTRLAVDQAGRVFGLSDVQREPWMRPAHFWLQVIVAPEQRRRGIGTTLFTQAARFARSQGAAVLESSVRDDDAGSLHFAERRDYRVARHSFDSSLDLAAFDESRFSDLLGRVEAEGFRFFSLADAGPLTEVLKHKLYELNRITALDNPGNNRTFPTYASFDKNVFSASWFRADTQLLAADGERWVGLSALAWYPEGRLAANAFTGVLPEYRGRGLATALKLHAIRLARRLGAGSVRTNNDSLNAPMLAVNRSLGYGPEPGLYHLECILEAATKRDAKDS